MVLSIASKVKKDLGCLKDSLVWSVRVREVAVVMNWLRTSRTLPVQSI